MRSALAQVPSIQHLTIKLNPPVARFAIDSTHTSMQDVVRAIRGAGSSFDGKLELAEDPTLSDSKLDVIDKALEAVKGVKNTGWPDEHGIRVITFEIDKQTYFTDIVGAGKSVGIELKTPPEKK